MHIAVYTTCIILIHQICDAARVSNDDFVFKYCLDAQTNKTETFSDEEYDWLLTINFAKCSASSSVKYEV